MPGLILRNLARARSQNGCATGYQVLYEVPSLLSCSEPEWTSSTPVPDWSGVRTASLK